MIHNRHTRPTSAISPRETNPLSTLTPYKQISLRHHVYRRWAQRLLTEAASDYPGNHHYCWNHDESDDVSHVGITYLFEAIGVTLE